MYNTNLELSQLIKDKGYDIGIFNNQKYGWEGSTRYGNQFFWAVKLKTPHDIAHGFNPPKPKLVDNKTANKIWSRNIILYPAYLLSELPIILKQLQEKLGWDRRGINEPEDRMIRKGIIVSHEGNTQPEWKYHYLKCCELSCDDQEKINDYLISIIK